MRAIVIERHGGGTQVSERLAPQPGSGELLIDVAAAGEPASTSVGSRATAATLVAAAWRGRAESLR
jgi:hypothetical protein